MEVPTDGGATFTQTLTMGATTQGQDAESESGKLGIAVPNIEELPKMCVILNTGAYSRRA